jgi:hypothetical protein
MTRNVGRAGRLSRSRTRVPPPVSRLPGGRRAAPWVQPWCNWESFARRPYAPEG